MPKIFMFNWKFYKNKTKLRDLKNQIWPNQLRSATIQQFGCCSEICFLECSKWLKDTQKLHGNFKEVTINVESYLVCISYNCLFVATSPVNDEWLLLELTSSYFFLEFVVVVIILFALKYSAFYCSTCTNTLITLNTHNIVNINLFKIPFFTLPGARYSTLRRRSQTDGSHGHGRVWFPHRQHGPPPLRDL